MTDHTTQDLLPCPFCGGESEFERKGDRSQSTIVTCNDCGATLENGEEWGHGRAWNTRTPAPDPAAIREAALREAIKSLRIWHAIAHSLYPNSATTVGMAADVVEALIGEKK